MLQREGDVDVFGLEAATGTLTAALIPHTRGANTLLKLSLLNADGELQAAQPARGANGNITWTVMRGAYFLKVESGATGSSYGSLGNYRLTAEYLPLVDTPPMASFTIDNATVTVGQNVSVDGSASSDDIGITAYKWDFGDAGGPHETVGPRLDHLFTQAGTYQVSLTVIDNKGLTSDPALRTITVTQANTPPVAVIKVTSATGSAPLGVALDATASTDDQEITSYLWTITGSQPEMTSTSPEAQFNTTFLSAGTYEARLIVTDGAGLTSTATQTITVTEPPNTPPVAAFTASTTSGPAPLTVTFDASASTGDGKIVSYSWDFGDGQKEALLTHYGIDINNQTEPLISNYYFVPGTYVVTLTVKDDKGQVSEPARQVITVTVPNQGPVANFFKHQVKMDARNTIDFDASNSTDDEGIVSYRWEWGDGSPATETTAPTVSHVFPSGGLVPSIYPSTGYYMVKLTVKDRQGAWSRIEDRVGIPAGMQPSVYVDPSSPDKLYIYPTIDGTLSANHVVWVSSGRGTPLEGAEVRWRLQGSSSASGTSTSNNKGAAHIKLPLGPKTGTVCVEFIIESISKPGFYYEPQAPFVRSYCAAAVVAGAPSITFTKAGDKTVATASVTVKDKGGNPASGVMLLGDWWGGASNVSATTDSAGVAAFQFEMDEPMCLGFNLKALSKPGHRSAPIATPSDVKCPPGGNDIVVTPFMTSTQ